MASRTDRTPLSERFWAKVDKTEDCWLWTGSQIKSTKRTGGPYGRITEGGRRGKLLLAHRVSFFLVHGWLPVAPDTVDHACLNTLCVRPDHLRVKSPAGQAQYRNGVQSNNTSGTRGVSQRSDTGKWKAKVMANGVLHRAQFDSYEEAARQANDWRLEYHID